MYLSTLFLDEVGLVHTRDRRGRGYMGSLALVLIYIFPLKANALSMRRGRGVGWSMQSKRERVMTFSLCQLNVRLAPRWNAWKLFDDNPKPLCVTSHVFELRSPVSCYPLVSPYLLISTLPPPCFRRRRHRTANTELPPQPPPPPPQLQPTTTHASASDMCKRLRCTLQQGTTRPPCLPVKVPVSYSRERQYWEARRRLWLLAAPRMAAASAEGCSLGSVRRPLDRVFTSAHTEWWGHNVLWQSFQSWRVDLPRATGKGVRKTLNSGMGGVGGGVLFSCI